MACPLAELVCRPLGVHHPLEEPLANRRVVGDFHDRFRSQLIGHHNWGRYAQEAEPVRNPAHGCNPNMSRRGPATHPFDQGFPRQAHLPFLEGWVVWALLEERAYQAYPLACRPAYLAAAVGIGCNRAVEKSRTVGRQ